MPDATSGVLGYDSMKTNRLRRREAMLGNRKTSVRVFQYGDLLAFLPQRLKDGIPVGTGEPVRISLCDACGESDGLRPAIHEGLRPGNGFAAGTAAATHKTDDGAVTQRFERAGLLFDCGEVARSRTEIFRLLAADNAYFHVNSLMSGVKKGRGFPPLAFTGKRGFPIWPQQSGQGPVSYTHLTLPTILRV